MLFLGVGPIWSLVLSWILGILSRYLKKRKNDHQERKIIWKCKKYRRSVQKELLIYKDLTILDSSVENCICSEIQNCSSTRLQCGGFTFRNCKLHFISQAKNLYHWLFPIVVFTMLPMFADATMKTLKTLSKMYIFLSFITTFILLFYITFVLDYSQ